MNNHGSAPMSEAEMIEADLTLEIFSIFRGSDELETNKEALSSIPNTTLVFKAVKSSNHIASTHVSQSVSASPIELPIGANHKDLEGDLTADIFSLFAGDDAPPSNVLRSPSAVGASCSKPCGSGNAAEPSRKRKAGEDDQVGLTNKGARLNSSVGDIDDANDEAPAKKLSVLPAPAPKDAAVTQHNQTRKADDEEGFSAAVARRAKRVPKQDVAGFLLERNSGDEQVGETDPGVHSNESDALKGKTNAVSLKRKAVSDEDLIRSERWAKRPRLDEFTPPNLEPAQDSMDNKEDELDSMYRDIMDAERLFTNNEEATPPSSSPSAKAVPRKLTRVERKAAAAIVRAVKSAAGPQVPSRKQRRALARKAENQALAEAARKAPVANKAAEKPLNRRPPRPAIQTPVKPQSLRRLAAEIREMIFEYCDFEWTGRSPPLVRALRSDKPLHAEAMRVFLKGDHVYSLNRRNNWSFGSTSVELILTIKKIKIEIQEYRTNPNFSKKKHQPKMIQVPHFTKNRPVCRWPIKVQEVIIEGTFDKVCPLILRNFEHYLAGFQQRLKKVTLDLRYTREYPSRSLINAMIERVNRLFKVEWHENRVLGG